MSRIDLDKIRTDGGTQPRDHISGEVVERYAEALMDGALFPPVVLFYDGKDYWLADGYHRHMAAEAAGSTSIEAEVHQGTRREAILYSVGANATHGYPRSNADKRRAVLTLLRDPEWSRWNDSEIARRANTSHTFVAKLRADHLETFQDSRTVRRGGTVYQQNTANIGQSRPSAGRLEYERGVVGGRYVHRCRVCLEIFDRPIWHCGVCDHHWPMERHECHNCHETERPDRPSTGEREYIDPEIHSDDPPTIPPELDRREPPFPPQHAPIAGKIDWLIEELNRNTAISPAQAAKASMRQRGEMIAALRAVTLWLGQYEKELTDGNAEYATAS